ncbi:hypothetical protein Q8A67_019663 [Cirrhinus molitorella]|uniref:Uncharacterized protein n=1 Tax=Cirrhinus molitorella TaxID=172907 RepID=A0AA88PFZ2_9TELE|nr:hypothetical protein Q8A67_019663 [Cirrhinus molitorella]
MALGHDKGALCGRAGLGWRRAADISSAQHACNEPPWFVWIANSASRSASSRSPLPSSIHSRSRLRHPFARCSVRPAERHCRLVTRDLSDLVGTLIRYSCSFPPLPALAFCLSQYDGAKGEGGKPNKGMCASAIVERDPSLVCQNAPFTMAFRIPTLEKVAGERAACRPHGNKTLGRVEKKRGCRSTPGPCPYSQKFPGSRRNIVRLRQLPESSFNPARRWIALLAQARRPRIQDGKDKNRMK